MHTYVQTGLSLYEWAEIMGVDPWELSQFTDGFPAETLSTACSQPFFQFPYQADRLSREEIATAIASAERKIAEELGFFTYPRYTVGEKVQYPRPANRLNYDFALTTPRGALKSFRLEHGNVIGPGILARTLIASDVPISLTDEDGDTVAEVMHNTNPIATTVTDIGEIGVYFKAADRVGIDKSLHEGWRIKPLLVTISGGNLNFRGFAGLAMKPLKAAGVAPQPLNVGTADNYITQVDVYRVYRDDRSTADYPQQGVAVWETYNCTTTPCAVTEKAVCIGNRDAEQGLVFLDNTSDDCWRYAPDKVTVNYLSGIPYDNGRINTQYAEMVAKLATALFPNEKCGCERSNQIINYWRHDVTVPDANGQVIILSDDEARNSFGNTRRGTIDAWRTCQELANLYAFNI